MKYALLLLTACAGTADNINANLDITSSFNIKGTTGKMLPDIKVLSLDTNKNCSSLLDHCTTVICKIENEEDTEAKGDVLFILNQDGKDIEKRGTYKIGPKQKKEISADFKEAKFLSTGSPSCKFFPTSFIVNCDIENNGAAGSQTYEFYADFDGVIKNESKTINLGANERKIFSHTFSLDKIKVEKIDGGNYGCKAKK